MLNNNNNSNYVIVFFAIRRLDKNNKFFDKIEGKLCLISYLKILQNKLISVYLN